jgi:hypothetical protein
MTVDLMHVYDDGGGSNGKRKAKVDDAMSGGNKDVGSIKADGNHVSMAVDNANDSEGNGEIAMDIKEEETKKKSAAVHTLKSALKKTNMERGNGRNKKDNTNKGSRTSQFRHKYDACHYMDNSDEEVDSEDERTNSEDEESANPKYVSFEGENKEDEDGFTTVTYRCDVSGGRGGHSISRSRNEEAKRAMQEATNKQLNDVVARQMAEQEEVTIVMVITVPDHNSTLEAMQKF